MARELGVPYGRTRCTICGALGVNRATCTGEKETHAALAGPYNPQVNTGNGCGDETYEREYEPTEGSTGYDPTLNEAPPRPGENPATLDEIFTGEIVYTPPIIEADTPPTRVHNLVKTTLTFITTTPIALENACRLAIQEADIEHIWLDTDFEDVTV